MRLYDGTWGSGSGGVDGPGSSHRLQISVPYITEGVICYNGA